MRSGMFKINTCTMADNKGGGGGGMGGVWIQIWVLSGK